MHARRCFAYHDLVASVPGCEVHAIERLLSRRRYARRLVSSSNCFT